MRIKVRYGFERNEQIKQENFENIHTGFSRVNVVPEIPKKNRY